MAKPYVIRDLEKEHGDLHKVIPDLTNQYGQAEAARQLKTTQGTISNWLRDNGYEKKGRWVRVRKAKPQSELPQPIPE